MVQYRLLLGALALVAPGICQPMVGGDGKPLVVHDATSTDIAASIAVRDTTAAEAKTTGAGSEEGQSSIYSEDGDEDDDGSETDLESRGSVNQFGVSYSPYRADGNCKSQAEVVDDISRLKGKYGLLRAYGTDCGQVPKIKNAAKTIGAKVMLGIYDINQVDAEAALIVAGVAGDWARVHSVSVGNELVNNGQASTAQVKAAVVAARKKLRAAGFRGPVVAVDTFIATKSNPELCECSDFCAVNAHPYFDSTMTADQAGTWLRREVKAVKAALSRDMRVMITETGWPTVGATNGKAVPGRANQEKAIQSIRAAFADSLAEIVLFTAFDDLWKKDAPNDQHWGIDGAVSACDAAFV
ncbi:Glycosyl hydrolases family 17 [Geosmithia morbida]|uniref:Glycosyl hydrolases family 17 n=1 Tax=Geosmithia morbida TaxID=1094350 RepID=A0A9P5D3B0_9HYPO|nr:Glycosyl hydrolases family 17 [Geosmithia morbida]KAF4121610.1 Glycosyl hydrolases family 17 [Geosmithia morbida]